MARRRDPSKSLGAWRRHPRDARGLIAKEVSGELFFTRSMINTALRKREVGRFRRKYGEAMFIIASGEVPTQYDPKTRKMVPGRNPYAIRVLWVSIDPTSGAWRVTRVDAKGPAGHTEYRSWTEAVQNLVRDYPHADLAKVRPQDILRP